MIKHVENILFKLLLIVFVSMFSIPCMATNTPYNMATNTPYNEGQKYPSRYKTTEEKGLFDTFIPSDYVKALKDIYEKENRLKNTNTYFYLSSGHSILSVVYNSEDALYRTFCVGLPLIKQYLTPYLPIKVQPFFQMALDEFGHQLDILRMCEPKRYMAETILGYTSLLLMNTLSSNDRSYPYKEEIEAAIYYFSKTAGWHKGEVIQAHLNDLWNQPLNFGVMGQKIEEPPINASTCIDYSRDNWDPGYCEVFYTQKALNERVAGIAQEIYEDINTKGLWKYPSPPYDFNNLYKIESSYWSVEKVCKSPGFCRQFFKIKDHSNYAVALVDLFDSEAKIDCKLANQFVEQLILLKLLGPEEMNSLYQQTPQRRQFMFPATRDEKPFASLFLPDRERNLGDTPTVGSFTYLRNHDFYPYIHIGMAQGYNLVAVSKDRYMGFGPEFRYPLSYSEIKDIFYKEINKDPTSTIVHNPSVKKVIDKVEETFKNREYFEIYVDAINHEYWNTFTSAMQISLEEFNRIREYSTKWVEDVYNDPYKIEQ
jgi:hypothetical protein